MVPSILYADVIVDLSIDSVDKPFQYKVPNGWEERAVVGACVTIPFGNGNRIRKGYSMCLSYEPKFFVSKIKCIQYIE